MDLWLVHWPPGGGPGLSMWEALLAARRDGPARAVGVSNYRPELVGRLVAETGVAPAVNQVRWSPSRFDRARLEHSRRVGVVLEGHSPFRAGGLDAPVLGQLADRHGVTAAQVVVRWHVQHGVVVIPRSARRERIERNADVFRFALSDEEMAAVDGLSERS